MQQYKKASLVVSGLVTYCMHEPIMSGTLKHYVMIMQCWMQRPRWADGVLTALPLALLNVTNLSSSSSFFDYWFSHFLFSHLITLHSLFPSHPSSPSHLPVSLFKCDPKGQMSLFQTTSLSLDFGCSDIKMYEEPYAGRRGGQFPLQKQVPASPTDKGQYRFWKPLTSWRWIFILDIFSTLTHLIHNALLFTMSYFKHVVFFFSDVAKIRYNFMSRPLHRH